ncbi:MAG: cadherin-like domain-containing protein [Magnetospirillum sp.]|nr:cadherin-like domain-containing protein [Magnetospirillum sp.]
MTVHLGTGSASGGDATGDVLVSIENLIGSATADRLTGNGGDNVLAGGAGADSLSGGGGTDTADYGASAAGIAVDLATGLGSGGDANGDVLTGIESLAGSAFADILSGNGGANTLAGGSGDDLLSGRGGADRLDGGAGSDTASYAGSAAGVMIDLGAGIASGGDAAGDVLVGIENVTGSAGADQLSGDSGDNVLAGGNGDDVLVLGGGQDVLDGGAGSDRVVAGEAFAAYTVTRAGSDVIVTANGGSSLLTGIEEIAFADRTLFLDGRNNTPIAAADSFLVDEDQTLSLTPEQLLANDWDFDGDALAVTAVGDAVNGTVALVSGRIEFIPAANYSGPAGFSYTVEDGRGGSVTERVEVTVVAVNDAPQLGGPLAAATDEDAAVLAVDLLAGASDVEGDTLSVSSLVQTGGRAAAYAWAGADFSLDPAQFADLGNGETETLTFAYVVDDGLAGTAQMLTLTVTGSNDGPVVGGPVAFAMDEDGALVLTTAALLANAVDPDGDPLTVSAVSADTGSLADNSDGTWTFRPATDVNGTAALAYTIGDGSAAVAGTATIAVAAVNDAPVAGADAAATDAGTPLAIAVADLLANDSDVDGDTLAVQSVQDAVGGAVSLADGVVTFAPTAGFSGAASFTYTVTDGNGGVATQTVAVEVTPRLLGGPGDSLVAGTSTVVNTYRSGLQMGSSVAVLADGSRVVTWLSNGQDGSGHGCYGQRYDAAGSPLGAEFRINTTTTGDQHSPRVTALAGGGFVVAWYSFSGDYSYGMYQQRYDAGGSPVGDEARISLYGSAGTVQGLPDGGWVAAWISLGGRVVGQRYDAAGNRVGAEFAADSAATGAQTVPSLAVLADGSWVTIWQAVVNGAYSIQQRHFAADGTPIGAAQAVTMASDTGQDSIAALADGGWVVTWDAVSGATVDAFARVYNADGSPRTGAFCANTRTDNAQSMTRTVGLADGSFVVTWISTGQLVANQFTLCGQRYDASGHPLGGEFVLADAASQANAHPGGLAALPGGGFVAAMGSLVGGANSYDVWMRDFAAAPPTPATYSGTAGADVLYGTSANDTLVGLAGADTYRVGCSGGSDVVDNRGHGGEGDKVSFDAGIAADQLWFSRQGSDLTVGIVGTAAGLTVDDWYLAEGNRVDSFVLQDGRQLMAAQVENLVTAMAGLTPPGSGQLTLTAEQHHVLDPVLAVNWQTV